METYRTFLRAAISASDDGDLIIDIPDSVLSKKFQNEIERKKKKNI